MSIPLGPFSDGQHMEPSLDPLESLTVITANTEQAFSVSLSWSVE